jgi:hypothetical protein
MPVTILCSVHQLIDLVGVMLSSLAAVQTSSLAKVLGRPAWIRRTLATVTIIAPARSAPPSCAGVSSNLILTLMLADKRIS